MAISVYLKSRSLSLYLQLETASDKILMVSRIVHELYSLRIISPAKRVEAIERWELAKTMTKKWRTFKPQKLLPYQEN